MTAVTTSPRAVLGTDSIKVVGQDGTSFYAGAMDTIIQVLGTDVTAAGDDTHTAGFTATAAQVFSGGTGTDVLNLTGTLAAAANLTLPLVTDLVAAISNFRAGMSFTLRVINASPANFDWTVVTNTGWTTSGVLAIAQNSFVDFLVTMTSATAATIKNIGTGSTVTGQYGGWSNDTHTAGFTATGAQVFAGGNGFDAITLSGTLGAGAAFTLPLVTTLVAAIPNFQAGMSFVFRVINASSAAFTWTVTTNTGWTTGGTLTVAQNTYRDFLITMTSATAATIQSIGTGTNS